MPTQSDGDAPTCLSWCISNICSPITPDSRYNCAMSTENKLVLIDGHALAYRMYFALNNPGFQTSSGEPTNATYGFTRQIFDLIFAPTPPAYFAVSFDVGRTFRDDWFEAYKGTREKMPDELALQINRIKEVVQALNIPIMELDGYEADDVLGTIARQAKPLGVPVHILTGDRDLLQLVDDNTTIELPKGRYDREPQIYNSVESVVAKMGVRPDQIVDYKALEGDASDNIPGVKGVGKKTATTLLGQYDTLDAIYENLEEIKPRFSNKLRDDKDNAYLSQKLARIVTDAPITLDIEACRSHDIDPAPVMALLRELEFRTLTDAFLKNMADFVPDAEPEEEEPVVLTEAVLVRNSTDLDAMLASFEGATELAFDLETTGLDKETAEIVGIALCAHSPQGFYIPVGHLSSAGQATTGQMGLFATEPQMAEGQVALDEVLAKLRPILTDPAVGKVAHNAKYDYSIMSRYGLDVTPIVFDTMIGEWLTNPGTKFKGLKDLSLHRLGISMTEYSEVAGKGKNKIPFSQAPIDQAGEYAAADADITLRLAQKIRPELADLGLAGLMNDMEMPLVPILTDMERYGVKIDTPFFAQTSQELALRLGELEKEIHEIAGRPFNVNSTQQLSDVLFLELDIPHERLKKTKSGHYSTRASVLEEIRPLDKTGIIDKIMEYRELGKLKSTYVDALPLLVNERTGRIHTSFNQTGTVTGRIASQNPNLQNIPIRTTVGQQIRRGFVPKEGHVFVAADYSQIELRILAHISQDEALLNAFREDQDIHRTTAAAIHDVEVEEVTYNQRRFAKAVNFGLIYGMGPFRLAQSTDLTLGEAQAFIKTYFARFPGVKKYLDETKDLAADRGYVETLFGRRRNFPVLQGGGKSKGSPDVRRAEREAINHPIQGTAADIVKLAMIQLDEHLKLSYKARMILQVHDELVLEVPESELDEVKQLVEETMSGAYQLDVPLKVEANSGYNWLELKD